MIQPGLGKEETKEGRKKKKLPLPCLCFLTKEGRKKKRFDNKILQQPLSKLEKPSSPVKKTKRTRLSSLSMILAILNIVLA